MEEGTGEITRLHRKGQEPFLVAGQQVNACLGSRAHATALQAAGTLHPPPKNTSCNVISIGVLVVEQMLQHPFANACQGS